MALDCLFYILKEPSCYFFSPRNNRCDALICCAKGKSKVLELCGLECVLGVSRSLTLPGAPISFTFLCMIGWAAAVIRRKILPMPWSIKAVKSEWTDKGRRKIANPDSHHVSGCCSRGRQSVSYWLIKQRECWDWSFLPRCLMGENRRHWCNQHIYVVKQSDCLCSENPNQAQRLRLDWQQLTMWTIYNTQLLCC